MLKKMRLMLAILLTGLILVACANHEQSSETYQQSVASLQEITIDDLNEKVASSEEFLVYLGRPSCEYCQVFVQKLAQAHQDKLVTVYYVDSDKAEQKTWDDFIAYFNIKTVPNFSYFSDRTIIDSLHKGSESTVEEISDFLDKYGDIE